MPNNKKEKTQEDVRFLDLKVSPSSSKNEVLGVAGGRLRVKIAAAAEDGKANAALLAFLAREMGIARKDISLVKGEKSRLKTVAIRGAGKEGGGNYTASSGK